MSEIHVYSWKIYYIPDVRFISQNYKIRFTNYNTVIAQPSRNSLLRLILFVYKLLVLSCIRTSKFRTNTKVKNQNIAQPREMMYKMTLRSCATGRQGVGVGIERYLRSCHEGDAAPTPAGNYCRPLFEGTAPYLKPPALKPSRFGGHMIYCGVAGEKNTKTEFKFVKYFVSVKLLSLDV